VYHNLINYDQGYRQRNLVVISIFRRFSLYSHRDDIRPKNWWLFYCGKKTVS